jgi:hypothetical protein
MATEQTGLLQIANANADLLPVSQVGDLMLTTSTASQRILIGTSNTNNTLLLTPSSAAVSNLTVRTLNTTLAASSIAPGTFQGTSVSAYNFPGLVVASNLTIASTINAGNIRGQIAASNIVPGAFSNGAFTFPGSITTSTFMSSIAQANAIVASNITVTRGLSIGVSNVAPDNGLVVQGKVGIGKSNPSYTLDVDGIVNAQSLFVNGVPVAGTTDTLNAITMTNNSNVHILLNNHLQAQWGGGIDTHIPGRVAVDAVGNLYMAGHYGTTTSVPIYGAGNSPLSLPAATPGNFITYLIKYNAHGHPQWFVTMSGTPVLSDIIVDGEGYIYLAGYYQQSAVPIRNADGALSSLSLPVHGGPAAFLVKWSPTGTAQWVATVKETGTTTGTIRMSTDGFGNVFTTGIGYEGAVIYSADGSTQPMPLTVDDTFGASYVVKWNTHGIAQWYVTHVREHWDRVYDVAADAAGNMYVTGRYATLSPKAIRNANGTSTISMPPTIDESDAIYVIKYDSLGVAQWCTTIDGASTEQPSSLAVDEVGNVHVTGYYMSQAAVIYNAGGVLSGMSLPQPTSDGAFVVKWNTNGIAQWYVTLDGSSMESGAFVTLDKMGNVYLTGHYTSANTVIYNRDHEASLVALRPPVSFSAFLVMWDVNGVAQAAVSVDGANFDTGTSIAVDTLGNIYLSGYSESADITAYNADGLASNITLPPGTLKGYLIKYARASYSLLSTLGSANDGLIKTFVNKSTYPAQLNVCGASPSTVLFTHTIAAHQNTSLSWFTPTWYKTTDTPAASITSGAFKPGTYDFQSIAASNMTIQQSLGIGTSTPQFPLDVHGTLNALGVNVNGVPVAAMDMFDRKVIHNTKNVHVLHNTANKAIWALPLNGDTLNSTSVKPDAWGNVYIGGGYQSTTITSIYNLNGTTSGLTLPATDNLFHLILIKYNKDGEALWVARMSGDTYQGSIDVDNKGNVYLAGTSYGNIESVIYNANGSTTMAVPASTQPTSFVVQWDASGVAKWFVRLDGAGHGGGARLAIDAQGNIYTTGAINPNSAIIYNADGSSTLSIPARTDKDAAAYLVKFNALGVAQWSALVDGTSYDDATSVAVDASGYVYVSVSYGSST